MTFLRGPGPGQNTRDRSADGVRMPFRPRSAFAPTLENGSRGAIVLHHGALFRRAPSERVPQPIS